MTSFGPDQLAATRKLGLRATAGRILDFWNEWAIQILVLLSLTQQIILLLFSGVRRHQVQGRSAKRLLLWLAYQLGQGTALYALGNLSLRQRRVVAFWAPFLLLHVAGPDTITAYSLEDVALMERQLLTLVAQLLGAGYVFFKQVMGSGIMFSLGSSLMIAVAIAKFCEKAWALRCAKFDIIRASVESEAKEARAREKGKYHLYLEGNPPKGGFRGNEVDKEEFLTLRAHAVFSICKSAMVDSSENPTSYVVRILQYLHEKEPGYMRRLIELELSLVYDILYTKAAVVHTLHGYCIRLLSPVAVAASFLLFQFYGSWDGITIADLVITYVLLGVAFLMEMTSLLGALFSTWTFSFLCATELGGLRHAALCLERWHRLRHMVVSLRRLAFRTKVGDFFRLSRRWSGKMGQYNMLEMCTARPGRMAKMLGLQKRTVSVPVPDSLKDIVETYIEHMIDSGYVNTLGMVRDKWGMEALRRWEKYQDYEKRGFLGAELHEGIIIWHIATDIFLAQRDNTAGQHVLAKEVKEVSNYMMFLLTKRPDMLPGLAPNKLYQWTKRSLDFEWDIIRPSFSGLQPSEYLAKALYKTKLSGPFPQNARLARAIELATELMSTHEALKLVREVWIDFLIYTANRCSRESHAKKLNSGSEFTTIVWLMTEHLHQLDLLDRNMV